jgi:hypothetical protein
MVVWYGSVRVALSVVRSVRSYGMVWYGMVGYGMVWYGMVWYGMVWYGMVWYGMVWYGMDKLSSCIKVIILHIVVSIGMVSVYGC